MSSGAGKEALSTLESSSEVFEVDLLSNGSDDEEEYEEDDGDGVECRPAELVETRLQLLSVGKMIGKGSTGKVLDVCLP